jgi:hypothetical protein
VSLHSHTLDSHEPLSFIYGLTKGVRLIGVALDFVERQYRRTHSRPLDLSRAYWTPPLAPYDAWSLERSHIEDRIGIDALVSLTDHDSIQASLALHVLDSFHDLPISTEWTVPYRDTFFHFGVHNLPIDHARATMKELAAFTAKPDPATLPDLLKYITEQPDSLIVFNHPFWDEGEIGGDRHRSYVLEFCRRYESHIHALELNGLRPWKENRDVIELSAATGKPLISGGDRHGLEPNTTIDLTNASTFSEFAAEVRKGTSEVLFMKQYFEPFSARILQNVQDILANHENHGLGWTRWSDRVFYIGDDGKAHPFSQFWGNRTPLAVRLFDRGLSIMHHPGFRFAVRALARQEATR